MGQNTNIQIFILKTGIICCVLTVIIGAFGAHSLESLLSENQRIETYKTAVLYQFFHSLAIILCGVLANKFDPKRIRTAFILFLSGIVIFSGSLYTLSVTNITIFGAITPIGGLLFIIGWIFLFLGIKKQPN